MNNLLSINFSLKSYDLKKYLINISFKDIDDLARPVNLRYENHVSNIEGKYTIKIRLSKTK